MTLIRVFHAELLKMKRTSAWKMVVLCPALVTAMVFFVAYQAPFSTLHLDGVRNEWPKLARSILWFWTFLMMPLYITLQTAVMAGLDHSENHWKSLLARPVPRWTLYVAKLIAVLVLFACSMLVLVAGIFLAGAVLPWIQPEVVFGYPVPWARIVRDAANIAGLAFLALTLQYWVSVRWRSFSIAMGFGMTAAVVGFFSVAVGQQLGGWPQYVPWALPMLVLAKQPHSIGAALSLGGVLGLLASAIGCWDFCRREVQ
ncbi:MAG: ABC transporter permease [Acidobacteriota bacterium]